MSEGISAPKITYGDWIIVKKNRKPKILTKYKEERVLLDTGKLDSGIERFWVLSKCIESVQVEVVDIYPQAIIVGINQGSLRWVCSMIYAKPRLHEHKVLLEHLEQLRTTIHCPWVLLRDFNEVSSASKVKGGIFNPVAATGFLHMIEQCDLQDLGVPNAAVVRLSNLLGYHRTYDLGKYLGVFLHQGHVNRALFNPLLERIHGQLASWKSKLLNKAGKICLVKSVI
ncbi:hypothetical protein RJT34_15865 [Clitoria ternatea]|uniref:Uncharacterized protein n=1 Tax=Clitoria ternatea TaxID=43366 RepID=A0AAN9J673_CLITE